jgi:hypothetical protein
MTRVGDTVRVRFSREGFEAKREHVTLAMRPHGGGPPPTFSTPIMRCATRTWRLGSCDTPGLPKRSAGTRRASDRAPGV